MTTVTFFVVGNTKDARFFVRCDSVRSTPGGCFPQRSLSATSRVRLSRAGDFAEPFPPPLRELFCPRRSSAPSRPARGCAPLDPRQGAPCTCPASPFMAKPGLSFTHQLAVEKSMLHPHWEQNVMEKEAGQEKRNNCACGGFSADAGITLCFGVPLPVSKGCRLFFTVRLQAQTNYRLRRSWAGKVCGTLVRSASDGGEMQGFTAWLMPAMPRPAPRGRLRRAPRGKAPALFPAPLFRRRRER